MCHALSSALLSWQMKTQTSELIVCLEWHAMGTESGCCTKIPRYACYLRSLETNLQCDSSADEQTLNNHLQMYSI